MALRPAAARLVSVELSPSLCRDRARLQRWRRVWRQETVTGPPLPPPSSSPSSLLPAAAAKAFVPWLPNSSHADVMRACDTLAEAGWDPVPHIAVRRLRDRDDLQRLLVDMGNRSIRSALLVAGDDVSPSLRTAAASNTSVLNHNSSALLPEHSRSSPPRFAQVLDVLQPGLVCGSELGLRKVYLAGFPEGNALVGKPQLTAEACMAALRRKVAQCRKLQLQPCVVTQLCFHAPSLLQFAAVCEQQLGASVPLRIGLPPPLTSAALARICDSLRLRAPQSPGDGGTSDRQPQTSAATDVVASPLLSDLANLGVFGRPNVEGVHLFALSAAEAAFDWVSSSLTNGRTITAEGISET
eukprot:m.175063 g.175063  ORF g.175063 m.175063 type:complete len:355 (+) comp17340_c0_seq1:3488-4552(+)